METGSRAAETLRNADPVTNAVAVSAQRVGPPFGRPRGHRITLEVFKRSQGLAFQDSTKRILERVFNRFHQLDEPCRKKLSNWGVGENDYRCPEKGRGENKPAHPTPELSASPWTTLEAEQKAKHPSSSTSALQSAARTGKHARNGRILRNRASGGPFKAPPPKKTQPTVLAPWQRLPTGCERGSRRGGLGGKKPGESAHQLPFVGFCGNGLPPSASCSHRALLPPPTLSLQALQPPPAPGPRGGGQPGCHPGGKKPQGVLSPGGGQLSPPPPQERC